MATNEQDIIHYHVHLTGDFKQTGFGFSCLKQASGLHLAGHLRYISEKEVEMNLEGMSEQLNSFFSWCQSCSETASVTISEPLDHLFGLTEFNIINSL